MNFLPMETLATLFRVGAGLLGIPSALVLTVFVMHKFLAGRKPPTPSSPQIQNPDAVVLGLQGMTRVAETGVKVLGWIGKMVYAAAVGLSFVGLTVALALWGTSRGLDEHRMWARFAGGGLVLLFLGPAVVAALSTRGPARLVLVLLALACCAMFPTLWRGYQPAY
jgi:hypothetical protein